MKSKNKPIKYHLNVKRIYANEIENYSVLFKSGNDLRKDFYVMQSLKLMSKIIDDHNKNYEQIDESKIANVTFLTYNVLLTDYEKGLIEVINKASTLYNILEDPNIGSIKNYLDKSNENAEVIRKNYINSCAGYLLECYLLGLGDRHDDNIMITEDGRIFHIDFGFILTDEPKKIFNFRLAPEIKWKCSIVEPLLTDDKNKENPFNDTGYKNLMKACTEGFLALRKKANLLVNIFRLVTNSRISSINEGNNKCYEKRFMLNLNDEEACKELEKIIKRDYDSKWGYHFVDRYHGRKNFFCYLFNPGQVKN